FRRRSQPRTLSLKQAHLQACFELGEQPADRGLRGMHVLSRAGSRARQHDRAERLYLSVVHIDFELT
ncbi:hypothetical protein NY608_09385, partial [Enterobacter hormaechei]